MRIRDWSSDVCSSDLPQSVVLWSSMVWNGVFSACSSCSVRKPMEVPEAWWASVNQLVSFGVGCCDMAGVPGEPGGRTKTVNCSDSGGERPPSCAGCVARIVPSTTYKGDWRSAGSGEGKEGADR